MSEKEIALVTGANKGIGFAIADQLARRGMTVLVGARDRARRADAVARLTGDVHGVELDVTDHGTVERAAKEVETRFGRLDVLVNNAGIVGELPQTPGADPLPGVRQVFEVNVFGVIAVTEAMLPLLAPGARVVNVSSSVGSLADMTARDGGHLAELPALLAYPVSKTALNAVTAQYAKYLRDRGILVNAVCPGYVATDLNGHDGGRGPDQGAAIAVAMATLGQDGPTATFTSEDGPVPW
ncbi:SDR family NAD(P)-dependent oxidoreductase [Actinophytocola gossypii]|uniref:SDR family NAD(P)-dependent oxidoreductase n=1 Tax=Actinophytocola gossypii TaxID=2812003 RepID=A0ABT2JK34_9PSEU|nr:SDR family NAD(P)-dependent oxidoreductase [Actinophytocola gossypii]MCT2587740.1 SDR family NAD(P)-dependent oxidoreductase [Actinophytocola gossypii]